MSKILQVFEIAQAKKIHDNINVCGVSVRKQHRETLREDRLEMVVWSYVSVILMSIL